jgi:hypothetical protein
VYAFRSRIECLAVLIKAKRNCDININCYVYGNYIADVGYEVLTAVVIKSYNFWGITSCSVLKVDRSSSLVSCLAYFSTLRMDATCSSETLVGLKPVSSAASQEGAPLSS